MKEDVEATAHAKVDRELHARFVELARKTRTTVRELYDTAMTNFLIVEAPELEREAQKKQEKRLGLLRKK